MKIIDVNIDSFDKEVLEETKKVIVDFNAEWCGPCRMIAPVLEKLAEEKDNVKFVSINVDNNQDLAKEYNVFSIPCLVVIENGKEIKRSVGLISKSEIEELIGD